MERKCLLVVDMQNDFINPMGSLYIKNSDRLIPIIENIMNVRSWDLVVLTQDWHPANHISFFTSHENGFIGQVIETQNGKQQLWPPHCCQNTLGAQIVPQIAQYTPHVIVQKAFTRDIDSYSAFCDQSGQFKTGLDEILKSHGIQSIYICGVATNYCVKYTAMDSLKKKYKTYIITNAVASLSTTGDQDLKDISRQGAQLIQI